jgi:hypothetical protein
MGIKAQLGQIDETALWQWVGQQLELSPVELAAFQRDFWADDVVDEALGPTCAACARPTRWPSLATPVADCVRHYHTATHLMTCLT